MSDISIKRAHNRSHADAMKLAENVAYKLGKLFQMEHHWEDETLHFERSGVKGKLEVGSTDVLITAKLGLLLKPMKGKIMEELEKAIDRELAL